MIRSAQRISALLQSERVQTMGRQAGAIIIAQSMVVGAMPILTRLYSSDDFGLLGLFVSLTTILASIAAFGMSEAVTAAPNDQEAGRIVRTTLVIVCAAGAMFAIAGFLAIEFNILGYGKLPTWVAFLVYPLVVALAVTATFQFWLIRMQDWLALRRIVLFQAFMRVVLQLGFGLAHIGFIGLILGEFCMRIFVATYAFIRARAGLAAFSGTMGIASGSALLNRYKRFPLTRVPSNLLTAVNAMIIVPLIVALYGLSSGGIYTLVESTINLPVGVAAKAVGDIFLGNLIPLVNQREAATRFFFQTSGALFALMLVPAAVLVFYGADLFAFVFGEHWRQSGVLAGISAPLLLFRFAITPVSGALNVTGRPELKLWFDILVVIVITVVFGGAYLFVWPLQTTILVYASAMAGCYLVLAGLVWLALQNPSKTLNQH